MENQEYFASNAIDGNGVWKILQAVTSKPTTFGYMHKEILEAWKYGDLFTVYEIATQQVMPCFCIATSNPSKLIPHVLSVIWVDESVRLKGFAKLLIKESRPDIINDPLPGTKKFWNKMGYNVIKGKTLIKSKPIVEETAR